MTIIESKLKAGTLKLGTPGTDYSAQLTAVLVTPSATSTGDAVEVLSGELLAPEATTAYVLKGTAIQDWTAPDGLIDYSWSNDLTEVDFEWSPVGAAGVKYAGKVQVQAIEIGGDVGVRLTSDFEWPVTGVPTRTYPDPGLADD